jgi:hypothetical protein
LLGMEDTAGRGERKEDTTAWPNFLVDLDS